MSAVEKQVDALSARIEDLSSNVDSVASSISKLTEGVGKLTDTVSVVLDKVTVVDRWRADADKYVVDLDMALQSLTSRVLALEQAPSQAPPAAPSREEEGRASGHHPQSSHQGAIGRTQFPHATLVTGEFKQTKIPTQKLKTDYFASELSQLHENQDRSHQYKGVPRDMAREFRMPRIDFPRFTGEHPRLCKEKCEKYFRMCVVPQELWAPFATLHFHDQAAYWLQNFEAQHSNYGWIELCVAVEAKFGREMYHNYMRYLLAIKQTSDVLEYHTRFVDAMHKVMLHHSGHDQVLFVQKFIDGLKHEISSAIVLHKPRTVDAAMSLAVMQEEVLEASSKKYTPRSSRDYHRYHSKSGWSNDKGLLGNTPVLDNQPDSKPLHHDKAIDKWSNLKSLCGARGECFKCGAKWGPNHKCQETIPLHVMEELFEVLQLNDQGSNAGEGNSSDSDAELLSLSFCVVAGTSNRRTMRLHGMHGKHELPILIDSGSSASFISQHIVDKMQLTTSTATPVQVFVANGQKMICDKTAQDFSWLSQGHTFHTTVRVLPLICYDLVLGMDWLEYHSPMWIHWKQKIMRITHEGKRISLFGVKPKTKSCLQLSGKQLQGLLQKGNIAQLLQLSPVQEQIMEAPIPEQIQTLIQVYDPIFHEPKQLSPQRAMDHHIPLIPGATPVNVKPYRYSPSQKDEIESQLQDMLRNGIIRPSVSPFASPVLLVKKKDGSWCFCVDYRRVNALTVKNKYPMPVVDELLDELHGACWFTKLHLRSGYHQIRVVPSNIHKTTFKTHDGHWELRVMPFA
jgi:hypothetical protein